MFRQRGFTLIEMLVVVAVIVLLISMLLPALGRSRDLAKQTQCQLNLQQTYNAHWSWASDHLGRFVEGQPSYHVTGHYAVWFRTLSVPSQGKYVEYGKYRKHGVLAYRGYAQAKLFYCPNWVGNLQYGVTGGQYSTSGLGGGWYDNTAKVPANQRWMQTHYHYNSMFGSADYANDKRWRAASKMDRGDEPLMADAFSDPNRNIDNTHLTGYNVMRLSGSVDFFQDPTKRIRDLNGGSTFHASKSHYLLYQSKAWRIFAGIE